MKKISYVQKSVPILILVLGFLLIGCSGDTTTPVGPSDIVTITFDHNVASFDISNLGVVIDIPQDAIVEGQIVPLQIQVAPADFPQRAYASSIYSRIGWVGMTNAGDPDIHLQDEIRIAFPLNENYIPSTIYSVFRYDPSDGLWLNTGKHAVIADDGLHAIFSADNFGIWGVFEVLPLTVEISANRTTAQAPASINLNALIDGGSPPYAVIWWYGDDSDPETGISVSHLYADPVTYTPCVIVVDAMNRQVSDELNIHVR